MKYLYPTSNANVHNTFFLSFYYYYYCQNRMAVAMCADALTIYIAFFIDARLRLFDAMKHRDKSFNFATCSKFSTPPAQIIIIIRWAPFRTISAS